MKDRLVSLSTQHALAHGYRQNNIQIVDPWTPAKALDEGPGIIVMITIKNTGRSTDRLQRVESFAADCVELIGKNFAVRPGESLALRPDGSHLSTDRTEARTRTLRYLTRYFDLSASRPDKRRYSRRRTSASVEAESIQELSCAPSLSGLRRKRVVQRAFGVQRPSRHHCHFRAHHWRGRKQVGRHRAPTPPGQS
jgi:hypothetical protein